MYAVQTVGASLLAIVICQAIGIFDGVHIHSCDNGQSIRCFSGIGGWLGYKECEVFLFCDGAAGRRCGFCVAENVDYLPRVNL